MAGNRLAGASPVKLCVIASASGLFTLLLGVAQAAAAVPVASAANQAPPPAPSQTLEIDEYTVLGNHLLPEEEIDDAVYPYLGPGQSVASVDAARAALQKLYAEKGYATVAVEIPPQHVVNGVVILQVVEGKIGRLNINGARYYLPSVIRSQAPSLEPGTVPNFKAVTHDIVALNSWPDRQVTPVLRAGSTPGTVDVDLNVKDTLPLHGSLELNNDYSQNTKPLRLNASLSYDNLWQRGDTISLNYEVAPQNVHDAEAFEASYLARIPDVDWASLLFYGLTTNSNVATLGSITVISKGQIIGARGVVTLPGRQGFYETLSAGIDYKHFDENVMLPGTLESGPTASSTPVTYYPFTASYTAIWGDTSATNTQLDLTPVISFRGLGSNPVEFDNKRFESGGNFAYLRGDISRTQELPAGFELYGKIQGQIADQPLVNSEQFPGGGEDSVRGYLESEVLGDNAILGSLEIRTPSLAQILYPKWSDKIADWRIFAFSEGGQLNILDPLPDQQAVFNLASIGIGTRIKLVDHLNGTLDLALPLVSSVATKARDPRIDFRVWVAF